MRYVVPLFALMLLVLALLPAHQARAGSMAEFAELDSVEQLAQAEWDDVEVDAFACIETNDDVSVPDDVSTPEGHECDFPHLRWALAFDPAAAVFAALLPAVPPAPVFLAFRPPRPAV